MEAEIIFEVLKKLTGEVTPYADSSIDEKRLENMKVFIEVFDKMHYVIDDIAYKYKNSLYHSAKEIGVLCDKHIDSMGIKE